MADLVSVITPVYNREAFLEEAIASIAKQPYRPVELVLADDGSKDRSPEIIREAAARHTGQDGFTVVAAQQPNAGAPSARNLGLRHSSGAFIVYVDSDDLLLPEALIWATEKFKAHPEADLIYFPVQPTDDALKPLDEPPLGKAPEGHDGDCTDYLWHTMGPLYRRNAIVAAGPWPVALRTVDDWEYGSRIRLLGAQAVFDERPWALYRQHDKDRLNVYAFSEKYVLTVEKACDLIAETARECERLNPIIGGRLARRLLVHALEFGANGHRADQQRLLSKALALPNESKFVPVLCHLAQMLGFQPVSALLYKLAGMRQQMAQG